MEPILVQQASCHKSCLMIKEAKILLTTQTLEPFEDNVGSPNPFIIFSAAKGTEERTTCSSDKTEETTEHCIHFSPQSVVLLWLQMPSGQWELQPPGVVWRSWWGAVVLYRHQIPIWRDPSLVSASYCGTHPTWGTGNREWDCTCKTFWSPPLTEQGYFFLQKELC